MHAEAQCLRLRHVVAAVLVHAVPERRTRMTPGRKIRDVAALVLAVHRLVHRLTTALAQAVLVLLQRERERTISLTPRPERRQCDAMRAGALEFGEEASLTGTP